MLDSLDISPLVVLPFRSMESLVVFLCCLAHTVHLWRVYNEHETLTYMRYVNLKGSDGYRYILENKYRRVLAKTGDGNVQQQRKRNLVDLDGKPMEWSFSSEATSAKESNFSSDNDLVMLVKERGYIRFKTDNEFRHSRTDRSSLTKTKYCQTSQTPIRAEMMKTISSEFPAEEKNPPGINERVVSIVIENTGANTNDDAITQRKDLQFEEISERDESRLTETAESKIESFIFVPLAQASSRYPKTEVIMRKNIRFAPTSSTRDLKGFKNAIAIDGAMADFLHKSCPPESQVERCSALSLRSSLFGSQQLFRFRMPSIHLQDSIEEALNK